MYGSQVSSYIKILSAYILIRKYGAKKPQVMLNLFPCVYLNRRVFVMGYIYITTRGKNAIAIILTILWRRKWLRGELNILNTSQDKRVATEEKDSSQL